MNYKLELKQIVEFPRCRIYRDFIQTLITTKSIRTTGALFFLLSGIMLLCKLPHILPPDGTHYLYHWSRRVDLHSHRSSGMVSLPFPTSSVVHPSIFEEQNYITYSLLGKNRLVKFKISDWPKDNTVLEYNYPCKKIQGFSFSRLPKFTN